MIMAMNSFGKLHISDIKMESFKNRYPLQSQEASYILLGKS